MTSGISTGLAELLDAVALRSNDPALVLSRAFLVEGPLDENRLRGALAILARRHDFLHVHAGLDGGQLELRTAAPSPILLIVAQGEGLEPQELDDLIRTIVEQPLDVARPPLARVHWIGLGRERRLLVIRVHHLVCDLISAGRLLRELLALLAHDGAAFPPSPAGTAPDGSHLGDAPPINFASPMRARPAASLNGALDDPLTAQITAFCRREAITPSALFLAAWGWCARRTLDLRDIDIGFFSIGRNRACLRSAGHHALLRYLSLQPNDRWIGIEFVRRTAAAVTVGIAGGMQSAAASVPLRFGYQKAGSRPTEFEAAFALGTHSAPIVVGPLAVSPWQTPMPSVDAEIGLYIAPAGRGWLWRIDFDASRHDAADIDCLAGRFATFLENLVRCPDLPVAAIPQVRAGEVRPAHAVDQPLPSGTTWLDRIRLLAATEPMRVAMIDQDRSWTFSDIWDASGKFFAGFRAAGIGAEDTVALAGYPSAISAAALLGVLRAGAAFVPFLPETPPDRLRLLFDVTTPRFIFVSRTDGWSDSLPDAERLEDWLDDHDLSPCNADSRGDACPSNLAYVLFTSGSTGQPKGVEISRASLDAFLAGAAAVLPVHPHDRTLLLQPYTFDIALLETFLPLAIGATVVVAAPDERRDPALLADLLERQQVGVMQATPTLWRELVASGWTGRKGMRCLSGGEPLPADLAAAMLGFGLELWNLYGPTEATIWTSAGRVADPRRIDLGAPLPGVSHHVLDADMSPTPPGCVGELWIGGGCIARGYRDDPARTGASFLPDLLSDGVRLYRTGDRVRRTSDGRLIYIGRMDRQLKIAGQRVEPAEIEAALLDLPGINDAVVVDLWPTPDHLVLAACVVQRREPPDADDVLMDELRRRLPPHMIPAIHTVPCVPVLSSGKRDFVALRSHIAAKLAKPGQAVGAPLHPLERAVLAVWSEVLGRPLDDPTADFFAMGGQSLQLMRATSRLNRQFGVRLDVAELWRAPRAADVAARLRDRIAGEREALATAQTDNRYPATEVQRSIWTAHMLDLDGSLYTMALPIEIEGEVCDDTLAAALNSLVARHPVIASRFVRRDGALWADLQPGPFPLQIRAAGPSLAGRDEVDTWVTEFLSMPFDLAEGPLARALLIRRPGARNLLVAAIHHIVADGVSLPVLLRDFATHLAGTRAMVLPPATPENLFAAWAWQAASVPTSTPGELDFWRRRLDRDFWRPSAERRPARAGAPAQNASATLSAASSEAVRKLARRLGVSVVAVVLALMARALTELSSRGEFLFAMDFSRRADAALEHAVGLFVDQLLLPVTLSRSTSIAEAATAIQRHIGEGIRHFIPLAVLSRALRPKAQLDALKFAELPLSTAAVRAGDALSLHPLLPPLPARHEMTFVLLSGGERLVVVVAIDDEVCRQELGDEVVRLVAALADELENA